MLKKHTSSKLQIFCPVSYYYSAKNLTFYSYMYAQNLLLVCFLFVFPPSSNMTKLFLFHSAWDANPIKENCGVSLLANGEGPDMRPAYIRRDYLYPYTSYVGWAVLGLACFITLATLICIYILYDSWDR